MHDDSPLQRDYFVFGFPLSAEAWRRYDLTTTLPPGAEEGLADPTPPLRQVVARVGEQAAGLAVPPAEDLLALRTVNEIMRWVSARYFLVENPGALARGRRRAADRLDAPAVSRVLHSFVDLFPPVEVTLGGRDGDAFLDAPGPAAGPDRATLEMLLLFLNAINPAARTASVLFDDDELRRRAPYVPFVTGFEEDLAEHEPPGSEGVHVLTLLRAPMLASPDSLGGQLGYMREHWGHLLPADMLANLQLALDVLAEADVARGGEPGPPPVLEFAADADRYGEAGAEPEAFSTDADWMPNVVLMAKSVYVWLDQLSRRHGRHVATLADIPDDELDRLARWGVSGLWLIGLWERSVASRRIKEWSGNPDAAASAYALKEYRIADDLGGEPAWRDLSERAGARGIRLASDMVPNHMGIDSRWVIDHPEYFLQLDHPPYPAYRYTGGDLCPEAGVAVRIEDGYWDRRDAAVVFQRVDEHSGEVRYIYHGNDGTSMPWNDTAQLNFLLPEVRQAVSDVILDVARMFPIIRFDAAMTLAKKHFQRLWFPQPGDAGAIPTRAEHGMSKEEFDRAFPTEFWRDVVERVAAEAPDTLLLAEAFWLMEGYFVRTLGMHRVYNSAFMNMLKMEDNAKYRQTVKNVLEFSPGVLQRFVNFLSNPDERTAVEQFGRGDKYFGCAALLVTMPGLPMLGHGQIEGHTEKYGMEYKRAYWDEPVDEDLVRRHEREIFPLMRRRALFSGVENFAFYDFEHDGGWVDDNVFAYSNRHGNERALILFNNAYDSTAGRVRLSSAVNTGPANAPQLIRRGLGEALALDVAPGSWYALRDHIAGLEYLRPGRELAAEGFHCHLRGYQTVALAEFRPLVDDGGWSALAAELEGRGVPDLLLARRRRELAPQLDVLRGWLDPAVLGWLERGVPDAEPTARPDILADLPAPLADIALALRNLTALEAPPGAGATTRREWDAILEALPGSRALQTVYLARVLEHANRELDLPADATPLVREDLHASVLAWLGHEQAAARTAGTAEVLAGEADAVAELAAGSTAWFAPFLAGTATRRVLDVNEHDGTLWLVAERLEDWLLVMVTAALATCGEECITSLLDGRALILDAAREAGWRVSDLREHLAD